MGTTISKNAMGGGLAVFGIAGVGLSLYLQYLEDCKQFAEN